LSTLSIRDFFCLSNLESTPKSLIPPNPPNGGLKKSMIFRWFPGGVRGKTDENH
jgi:hypothetical protein